MIIRFEYCFLAIAFVFGMFATLYAQNPITISNPYAQFDSTVDQTNDQTNDGQTDVQIQNPFNDQTSNSAWDQFSPFVPRRAELLFVHRPSLAAKSELAGLSDLLGGTSSLMPAEQTKIDWIIAAGSSDAIGNLNSIQARNAFDDIAADLQAASGNPIVAKKRPTVANYLNSDFCALVMFNQPAPIGQLANWLSENHEDSGQYEIVNWLGHKIVENGRDDCCIVIQLDPKTFIVGNKKNIKLGMEGKLKSSESVAKMLSKLKENGFAAEMYFGTDVSAYKTKLTDSFLLQGIWSSLSKLNTFEFALDLQRDELLNCSMSFENESAASKFKEELSELINTELDRMEKQIMAQSDPDSFPNWQARTVFEFATNLAINQDLDSVSVTLPRPVDLEKTVKTYVSKMEVFTRDQEAQFDAIAAELTMSPVVVLSRNINAGDVIGKDDIKVENWPEDIIPDGAIRISTSVIGAKAKNDIRRGLPVLNEMIESASR